MTDLEMKSYLMFLNKELEDLFQQGMFSDRKLINSNVELSQYLHAKYPDKVKVDRESVQKYIMDSFKCSDESTMDKILDAIPKTIDLFNVKYGLVFELGNVRKGFLLRDNHFYEYEASPKTIARHLTVEYYCYLCLVENDYECEICHAYDSSSFKSNAKIIYDGLIEDKVQANDLEELFVNAAIDIASQNSAVEKVVYTMLIQCCMRVESRHADNMNTFYQQFMDVASLHSNLIVPNRDKIKVYLKEIGII